MDSPTSTDRSPEAIFSEIYTSGLWSPTKWNSGSGSDPGNEGAPYGFLIPALIKAMEAKTVVDLGCGDGRILASLAVDCPGVTFHGVDCCSHLINHLRNVLPHHHWHHNQLTSLHDFDQIPDADIYLTKDLFHHWPTANITNLIYYLQCNGLGVLIATQDRYQDERVTDCEMGGYRALSGSMQPWKGFQPQLLANYLHKAVWLLRF